MAEPIRRETDYPQRKRRKYGDPVEAQDDSESTQPSVAHDSDAIKNKVPPKPSLDVEKADRIAPPPIQTVEEEFENQALVRSAGEGDNRKIGEILVDQGVMKPRQVRRILRRQKAEGDRFGRTAREMGLASREDVKHALAMQRAVVAPAVNLVASPKTRELWCLNRQDTTGSEAIRTLRSQLILRSNDQEPKPVAVLSVARREGRSFIAANLATAYAQAGRRTLLVDADLRSPRQHRIFGVPNNAGFSTLLAGDHEAHPVFNVVDDLYVVPAGPVVSNPQELLCREYTGQWLDVAMRYFDVVLIDTPASGDYPDAELIAAWAGRSLIVVRKNATKSREVESLSKRVTENNTEISGYVLNAT